MIFFISNVSALNYIYSIFLSSELNRCISYLWILNLKFIFTIGYVQFTFYILYNLLQFFYTVFRNKFIN